MKRRSVNPQGRREQKFSRKQAKRREKFCKRSSTRSGDCAEPRAAETRTAGREKPNQQQRHKVAPTGEASLG